MNEDVDVISQQLDGFYKSRRIALHDFQCPKRDGCAKGAANFGEARAALVGERYGDPIRLVMVSSDRGGGYDDPAERTIEAVRSRNTRQRIREIRHNTHWYRTHVVVATTLSRFAEAELRTDEVVPRFAHTNSVRCCLYDGTKNQTPQRFLTRCKEYLAEELAIFRPSVVVTQGNRAAALPARRTGVVHLGAHEFRWIRLTHPMDRRGSSAREARSLLPGEIERVFAWWSARG